MRRTLQSDFRWCDPHCAVPDRATRARQMTTTVDALERVIDHNATLLRYPSAARIAAIRLVYDEAIARARKSWIGGIPTADDLRVVAKRVCQSMGLEPAELDAALKGHLRPVAVG